jgi:hypothetical protein
VERLSTSLNAISRPEYGVVKRSYLFLAMIAVAKIGAVAPKGLIRRSGADHAEIFRHDGDHGAHNYFYDKPTRTVAP